MTGKEKAPGEQGQAAQGWGLGQVGSARAPAWPALLPLSLSVHRMCPQVKLWGLNKFFCLEVLTTALLPGRLTQPEPTLSISMAGVVLRQQNTSEMGK